MVVYKVRLTDTGEAFDCPDSVSVLRGMEKLGRKGIPVGCRNGGCGVCKVKVTFGIFRRRVMSRAHVTQSEEAEGYVLACRIYPLSDLVLSVVGKMKRAFGAQIVRGEAT